MKKIIFLLTIITILSLAACTTDPTYYSKREMMKYATDIFGSDIELIEELSYPDEHDDERNMIYEYVFLDDSGLEFSVYATTNHIGFLGSQTVFYEENRSNNYKAKMIDFKSDEISGVLNTYNLEYSFEDGFIQLFLYSYKELEEASALLAEIDNVIAYECDYTNYPSESRSSYASISIKPDVGELSGDTDEWKGHYNCTGGRVAFSEHESERKKAEDIFVSLERGFVYHVRDMSEVYYILPDEILYKYPAEYFKIAKINSSDEDEYYYFKYDVKSDKYWSSEFDPCQESFENYNYSDKGVFKELVESLGGTYESEDLIGKWSIGGSEFNARLVLNDDSEFIDFTVYKDGEQLMLDTPAEESSNGTVSGRAFSVEDLEKMLNAEIEIDQKNQTGTIKIK